MRRTLHLALLLSLAAAFPSWTKCRADDAPAYSASDIIRRFSTEPSFGASRSLCIDGVGCGEAAPAKAGTEAFDLEVTFELGSDRLTPAARKNLDEFVKALADPALAARRFHVDGHTDGRGRDDINLRLSQRRAASVRNYLVSAGIDPANRRVETRAAE